MNWRTEDWVNPYKVRPNNPSRESIAWYYGFEEGADAMLKSLKPLLTTIHAQLCGIRMKEGKTSWYSALDSSIDSISKILSKEVKE